MEYKYVDIDFKNISITKDLYEARPATKYSNRINTKHVHTLIEQSTIMRTLVVDWMIGYGFR